MYGSMWVASLIALASGFAGVANAQSFPVKPVRIVVPFPPGGGADIAARVLADHMAKTFGHAIVVENRPGGSTIIGSEAALRAPADGYTMLVVFPSFVINPSLRAKMPFDPLTDFKAVGQAMSVPMAIAVHPSVPAKTLAELIALAKEKPGALSYSTPGIGTTHHVMGEMLKAAAKINIVHAPFQGGAPSLTAAVGGHVSMIYGNAIEVAPSVKSGKLRAIVSTSAERADVLPDAPTMREAGFPELVASNWAGLVVSAATPASAIERLNQALVRALQDPDVQEKFKTHGMSVVPGTPEAFGAFLRSESARYEKVVREAGVRAE